MSTAKTAHTSVHRPIARAAGIIGLGTLSSRILGFVRDMVIARFFGVTAGAQAFVVAFRIPNLFRDMLAEGAANSAYVPVFSRYASAKDRQEFWELATVVLNLLIVVTAGVVFAGIGLAGLIVRISAPGFTVEGAKLTLTIDLTRMMFPYLFLVSLAAYAMGLLNALKHFTVSAFAPCFLNIAVICSVFIFGKDVRALAYGVLIGGFLQLAVQLPMLLARGFRLRGFLRRFRHPEALVIGRLLIPRVVSSSFYQLNAFVDTIFGSLAWIVGAGGVAVLYYAYRLVLFPLGIFSTSLSQAILPSFSRYAAQEDHQQLRDSLSWSLRLSFFLLVPAAAGMAVLALPLVETIFGGGKFDYSSAHSTARTLVFYSVGIPVFGAAKILQSCFFSLKDTRTPALVAGIAVILNILLNLAFMFPLKIGGIALATSLSSCISFLVLTTRLRKKIGGGYERQVYGSLLRIVVCSLGMAAVCAYFLPVWFSAADKLHQALRLVTITLMGLGVYCALCKMLKVRELEELSGVLRRGRELSA